MIVNCSLSTSMLRSALFAWALFTHCGQLHADEDGAFIESVPKEMLAAFGEKSYADGARAGEVRITMLRSFHPPLMLKWCPDATAGEVAIHAKMLTVDRQKEEVRLAQNVTAKISDEQQSNLKMYLSISDATNLPKSDWRRGDILDGSEWIIEIPSIHGVTRLIRSNPLSLPSDTADLTKVTHDRIWKEQFLVTFILNLLMASGLDVNEVY